ncbi:hypothetical protein SEA_AUSTELLE_83 [Mycobacterium phage Austelle]|nr:hypothetical protein SEA_AUSTELLE_83 [Mycobacterium phage Austelle]
MDANMTNRELADVLRAMGVLPCGPTCHWRYGWCFDHNVSTGGGAEPWRP